MQWVFENEPPLGEQPAGGQPAGPFNFVGVDEYWIIRKTGKVLTVATHGLLDIGGTGLTLRKYARARVRHNLHPHVGGWGRAFGVANHALQSARGMSIL